MPDERPLFGNRYQIVRHIARGGMAQVYLARDLLLDRPVALKVLFPELSVDEAFVERFRREAQAAANLSYPNIVSIYDWGQGDHTYYIVMEYVDGETLSARIRRGPIPPVEAAGIAIATAGALSFAHAHNVIHRDVKPGNVLIDRSGHVKVADFGIARAVDAADRITQAGAVMGTATYFSPEQAQGHHVDVRSDVYSLGVVLYEMAVGRPPFQGESPVTIAYKHVSEAAPPPRSLNPAIPGSYEAIVLKAMAKAPADRYQTADALRADLERFCARLPVEAGVSVSGSPPGGSLLADPAAALTSVMGADALRAGRPALGTAVGHRPPPPAVPPGDGRDDTGPIRPRGSSRTGVYVALLLVLIAALALVGYFLGKDLGFFGGIKTLTIPNVAGQPAASARSALTSRGFTNITETTDNYSATVRSGDAIATNPPASSREKSNSPVLLEVSAGPKPVLLPSVRGELQAEGLATLQQHGFLTTVSTEASNSLPKGDVIRTDPAGNTTQIPGIRVEVIVSSGPKPVVIPPVTFDTPVQAGATLYGLGFEVTEKLEASNTVQSGEVIGTSPASGTSTSYGSKVVVYVSSGPVMVTVPMITGETQGQAAADLGRLHLQPNFTTEPVTTPAQNGRVQSVGPVAGTSVPQGSIVQVVIGAYTAPTTTTSTSTTSTTSSSSSTSTTSTTSVPDT